MSDKPRNDSFNPDDPMEDVQEEGSKIDASTKQDKPLAEDEVVPDFASEQEGLVTGDESVPSIPLEEDGPFASDDHLPSFSQQQNATLPSDNRPQSTQSFSSEFSFARTGLADTLTIHRVRPQEVHQERPPVIADRDDATSSSRISSRFDFLDAPSLFDTPSDSACSPHGSMPRRSLDPADVNSRLSQLNDPNDPPLFDTPSNSSGWPPLLESASPRRSIEPTEGSLRRVRSREGMNRNLAETGAWVQRPYTPDGVPWSSREPTSRSQSLTKAPDLPPLGRRIETIQATEQTRMIQAAIDMSLAQAGFWPPRPGPPHQTTEPQEPQDQATQPEGPLIIDPSHRARLPLTQANMQRAGSSGRQRPWGTMNDGSQDSSTLLSTNIEYPSPTSLDTADDHAPLLRNNGGILGRPIHSDNPAHPHHPDHFDSTSTLASSSAQNQRRQENISPRNRSASHAALTDSTPRSRTSKSSSLGQRLKSKMKKAQSRSSSFIQSLRSPGSSQRSLLQASPSTHTLPQPRRLEQQHTRRSSPRNYSYMFGHPGTHQQSSTAAPPAYHSSMHTRPPNSNNPPPSSHPYTHHPTNPSINTINTSGPASNPFRSLRRVSSPFRFITSPPRRGNNDDDESENKNDSTYHAMHVSMPDFSHAFTPDFSQVFMRKYTNDREFTQQRGYSPPKPPFLGWPLEKLRPWDGHVRADVGHQRAPPIPPRHPLHAYPELGGDARVTESAPPPKYAACSLPSATYASTSALSASASTTMPSAAYTTAPASAACTSLPSAVSATSGTSMSPSKMRVAARWVDDLVSSPIVGESDSTSSSSTEDDDEEGVPGLGVGATGGAGEERGARGRGTGRVCSRLLDQLPLNGDVQIAIALERAAGRRGGWWQPRVR